MAITFPLPLDHFSGGGNLTGDDAEALIRAVNALAAAADPTLPATLAALDTRVDELEARPTIATVDADYTVLLTDELTIIEADPAAGDGSIVIELPADFPVGFIVTVRQVSAGTVTFVDDGSSTVNAFGDPAPPTLAGQWAQVTAEVRAADTWLVDGRLA